MAKGGFSPDGYQLKTSNWLDFSIYLPFYVAIFRWSMFVVLRVIPSMLYKQIKPLNLTAEMIESGKYQKISKEDVTVVVTVYQPPEGFMPAMRNVRRNGACKVLIIADVTCHEMVQEMLDEENFDRQVFIVVCEHKAGKRSALETGIRLSRTKLTLLMDDDAVWVDTFLDEVILPFQYTDIGGVGVKQVAHQKAFWNMTDILADMRLSVRYLELRATTTVDRGCSCISGRTGCYLTSIVQNEDFMHEFMNEKFFGMQTLSGDDKFLTRWVVNHGYKTYHQLYNSCKLTTTFETGGKLLRQLIRWSRNTWRSDIKNLFLERIIWKQCPFTAVVILDKFITPFFLLFGPIYVFVVFWLRGMDYVDLIGYLIWLLVSRCIRLCYHFIEHPHHLVYLPLFIVFQYIQGGIRVWALFTLQDFNWGTRNVTVGKDGNFARTGEFAEKETEEQIEITSEATKLVKVDPFQSDPFKEDQRPKMVTVSSNLAGSDISSNAGSVTVLEGAPLLRKSD